MKGGQGEVASSSVVVSSEKLLSPESDEIQLRYGWLSMTDQSSCQREALEGGKRPAPHWSVRTAVIAGILGQQKAISDGIRHDKHVRHRYALYRR